MRIEQLDQRMRGNFKHTYYFDYLCGMLNKEVSIKRKVFKPVHVFVTYL